MKNKIIAMLLAAVLVLSLVVVSMPVMAAEDYTVRLTDAGGNETVTAEAGDTITLALSIENNPGIISVGVQLFYPKVLSLTAKPVLTQPDSDYYDGCSQYATADPYLVWLNMATGTQDNKLVTYNGKIAEVSFRIAADAQPGDYTVTLAAPSDKNTTAGVNGDGVILPNTNTPISDVALVGLTIHVEAHSHSFTNYVSDGNATCLEDGTETAKCDSCEAADTRTDVDSKLGHSFTSYVSDNNATYDADGTKTAQCDRCDATDTVADPGSKLLRNGWILESGKWAYYVDGVKATNCWKKDSTGWCYLGADGYMVYNKWVKDSTGWCYVGTNGYMVYNKWVKDSTGWCYVGANGYMVYNKWVKDSTGWCYVGANGYMVYNKWVKDSTGWCYVDASGYMVYNKWVKDSTGWCYVGANGYMVYNKWVKDSTGWCYVDASGYMVYNKWVKDGGSWYWINANGYMVYSRSLNIGGKTYHFNASGVCTNP